MRSNTATGTTATADNPRSTVQAYVGRFAPSPTGPLHFGSLVAATASYLEASRRHGRWLVRLEDVDRSREQPGAAESIVRALETLGFEWDGPIIRQSSRSERYRAALERLWRNGDVFACSCSRTEIAAHMAPGTTLAAEELRYPGTCRSGPRQPERSLATRFRVPEGEIRFCDRIQGEIATDVAQHSGDFVLKRRDGYFAYQLAVVVDDFEQDVTEVVRGADLLDNTPRQLLLLRALGMPAPAYAHVPIATDLQGRKLSKSSQAPALTPARPGPAVWAALLFLLQSPPSELQYAPLADIWAWAKAHWSLTPLAGLRSRMVPFPLGSPYLP